ncbi:hypothetical protein BJV74DRAFT_799649 [Russula compacta]|nr:hypothetical protein BJV74DRAFT_799649 [Russula compacta]
MLSTGKAASASLNRVDVSKHLVIPGVDAMHLANIRGGNAIFMFVWSFETATVSGEGWLSIGNHGWNLLLRLVPIFFEQMILGTVAIQGNLPPAASDCRQNRWRSSHTGMGLGATASWRVMGEVLAGVEVHDVNDQIRIICIKLLARSCFADLRTALQLDYQTSHLTFYLMGPESCTSVSWSWLLTAVELVPS